MAKVDFLARLNDTGRRAVIGGLLDGALGPELAARVMEQFDAALGLKLRQPGDAPRPEDNYWRGAWRIHDCAEPAPGEAKAR